MDRRRWRAATSNNVLRVHIRLLRQMQMVVQFQVKHNYWFNSGGAATIALSNGTCNGAAVVALPPQSMIGGLAPFTYSWSPSGQAKCYSNKFNSYYAYMWYLVGLWM